MFGFDILEKNNKYGQRIHRKLLNMTKYEHGIAHMSHFPLRIDPFTKISLFKPDGELTTG